MALWCRIIRRSLGRTRVEISIHWNRYGLCSSLCFVFTFLRSPEFCCKWALNHNIWISISNSCVFVQVVSVSIIAWRVYTFNTCEEAAKELQQEIKEAHADLKKKGLAMEWEQLFFYLKILLNTHSPQNIIGIFFCLNITVMLVRWSRRPRLLDTLRKIEVCTRLLTHCSTVHIKGNDDKGKERYGGRAWQIGARASGESIETWNERSDKAIAII